MSFVHLNLHSEYAIIDSTVQFDPLFAKLVREKVDAIAITDPANLFGMIKFYKIALAKKIKPILGAELWVEHEGQVSHVFVYCLTIVGYKNLLKIVSRGYTEGKRLEVPQIPFAWLQEDSEDLLAVLSFKHSHLSSLLKQGDLQGAEALLHPWRTCFAGRFYLEIQRLSDKDEPLVAATVELARVAALPVVATNAVRFLDEEDYLAHEARVCIHEGTSLDDPKRISAFSPEQYLKSEAQMQELFADLPGALENTGLIAQRCNVKIELNKVYLPDFPVPEGLTIEMFLAQESQKGMEERLAHFASLGSIKDRTVWQERLDFELSVINKMGFAGYFLIVADFIQWAKAHQIPVGPGRGSGAGSLVAYALKITDLDPIEYQLLFERFLNPERVSMPDFDVDFCMENRDTVIDYVAQRYGRSSVSQIGTFGTMAAKAVVRDTGRVLGFPYGFVDKIAKLIPFEIGMTLDKAFTDEPRLKERYDAEEDVARLMDLAKKLEGITRNIGKHAGGVVIAPGNLTQYTPLYCESESTALVTQWDKDDVEAVGLVKFDFLGLRTLTIIDWAVRAINEHLETPIAIENIGVDDPETYKLLKACVTTAVFQLESRGMKDLIKRLSPDHFEEIIALVALFRPGPLQSGMVDDFINRKHGRAQVTYAHPKLEPILAPTYGVILYQEQVMQIAQDLALYTLGGADLLRRAMGKKKPEEMAEQRAIFVKGAVENGIEEKTATYIFDLMEKFAGYGFNKSHSAAYALVSYQTAWLKTHYPCEFMAAVLSADMAHTEKVVTMIEECYALKIKILSPCINNSVYAFKSQPNRSIRFGLGAIKGVGESAIESIIQARGEGYTDLVDLCKRVDLRRVNRRVLETLIRSGALDAFGWHRAQLMAALDNAIKEAEQSQGDRSRGQISLFDEDLSAPEAPNVAPWADLDRLKAEKESLGFYLSGHPIESYQAEMRLIASNSLINVKPKNKQKLIVGGMISSSRSIITKRGDKMAWAVLDDRTARLEFAIFSDLYEKVRDKLVSDEVVIVELMGSQDHTGAIKLRAEQLYTWEEARVHYCKSVELWLHHQKHSNAVISQVKQLFNAYSGKICPTTIMFEGPEGQMKLSLAEGTSFPLCTAAIRDCMKLLGPEGLHLNYKS